MKNSRIKKHGSTPAAWPVSASRLLLPTLAAVGGGLASGSAAALELGQLKLHSTLGQPLRASINYALGPSEHIADYCVSLRPGKAANGLPAVTSARIRIADGVITLTGVRPVREPLITTRVVVKCPYTAKLSREYLIFVDPPGAVAAAVSESPVAPEAPTVLLTPVAPLPEAPPAVVVPQRRKVKNTPIQGDSRYRVQPGDSLSEIVQRLENRQVKLWDAIYTIFDANPDAFIDTDPNKLKAGSWLVIPHGAIVAEARIEEPDVADIAYVQPEADIVEAIPADVQPANEVQPAIEIQLPLDIEPIDNVEPVAIQPPQVSDVRPDYSKLRPGDIVPGDNSLFVSAEISVPTTSPGVPVAKTMPVVDDASNWISWLIGGAIALLAGMLLFGRKLRERFGSRPIGAAQQLPSQRVSDDEYHAPEAFGDVDYHIGDDSPTHENLVLDADLIAGVGLEQKTDLDVNQDFGFAVTTQLDFEIPERAALGDEPPSTDILPSLRPELESILESEILPEDDDYDMSVIVDVTKIRSIEDITSRDLRAVAVESDEETLDIDDYTISRGVDYEIVEDKFEDQLSATQALSDEIEKAAAELAERFDEQEPSEDDASSSGESTAVQLGTVSELDVTVNLPAENDVIGDLEDTGINEALTVDLPIDDKTVEMPSAGEEQTVEMPLETGELSKKAG